MNLRPRVQLVPAFESSNSLPPSYLAWLQVLTSDNQALALKLAHQSEVCVYELGASVGIYTNSDVSSQTVPHERIEGYFHIVCQGRVRVLTVPLNESRSHSLQRLEEGATFGGDHLFCPTPYPYQVIAATNSAIVARIPTTVFAPYLEELPQLQDRLQRQAVAREQLLFLKTLTPLKSLASQSIQHLLPYLVEITLPAATQLSQVEACQSGYFWLRQGEIYSRDDRSVAPQIGMSWGYPAPTPEDWVTATEVRLYQLPEAHWPITRTIAPGGLALPTDPRAASADLPHPISTAYAPSEALQAYRRSLLQHPTMQPTSPIKPGAIAACKPQSLPDVTPPTPINTLAPVPFPQPQRQRRHFWQPYPWIQQQSSTDCGVTCLAMVGQYWGKRFDLNILRNLAGVGRSGTTLKNLAKTAEKVGFQVRPVRASLGCIVSQKNPWIAHWEGDHYVVVYRAWGKKLLVADPARGKKTITQQQFLTHWTGYALLLDPTQQLNAIAPQPAPSLWSFGRLFRPYQSILGQIIIISLLMQVFGLFTPLFTQVILDQVVVQKSENALLVFALGLVIFSVWRIGLTGVRQYLLDYLSNRMDLTLVSGFVSHALRLPLKFFESRQVGDILTRIQENRKVQLFLVRQSVSTWLDALMAFVYAGLMFYYNSRLAILVVSLIPPIVLLTLAATPFLKQISREIFNEAAEQNSLVIEMMTGIATVKAAAAEQEVRWRWEEQLTNLLNVQFKGQKLANGLSVTSSLINGLGSVALLWYGATLVMEDQLTIGQFVAFNMLIGNVINPVLAVIGAWDEWQEVLISVERLNDVFAAEPEERPGCPMLILPPIRGAVVFEDVTFNYNPTDNHNTLQNISFRVEPGQTIAIVGRSGSGKTTLIKLLQAFYHPHRGRILIDGHDIRHISPHSLRSQLGVVPQDCFLFSGTILENIQIYRSEYCLEQVIEVAKLAEAHPFIQELPLGYNTKVGERGSNLSGGQRQRIAIARSLLGNPAILLLDEATSSLDTESERRFQQSLARISRDRTTFIIAHRLSTVQHADCILVLDHGILTEQGTHEELVSQQGLYYHLAQQQLNL